MRVAIVHDWLTGMRGGEKCLEAICEIYPGATLYTIIYRPGHLSPAIEQMKIRTSWIQKLPRHHIYYRHLLPFFPSAVESFDLREYDLVISSSHCVAKGAITGPGTVHLCYCYTPMRYAWDQYDHYFGSQRLNWLERLVIPPLIGRLRRWDVSTVDRVDYYAAISRYVAERIRRHYGREAEVIYPPVDISSFSPSATAGGFYLMVNALAPYKRVDLAIEAFNRLGLELRIVGTGQDKERLESLAGPNITFLGWISQGDLAREYSACRALVFPGEEDFGIAPLEAQASGRPVIAYGSGGVTETVRPHPGYSSSRSRTGSSYAPTGVFFTDQDSSSLMKAVLFFESHQEDFIPDLIRKSVLHFDRPRFKEQFAAFVRKETAQLKGA